MARVQSLSSAMITFISIAYEPNGAILITETFKTYILAYLY
jgi:hypothetical protein